MSKQTDINKKMKINFFAIPIFIISYNRLVDLKKIISRLEHDGYTNLIILDNASTDEKLLSYLHKLKHTVYFFKKNYGPYALFKCGLFNEIINSQYYVLTDPDIIPIKTCPNDYVEYFYEILQKYPEKTKAGFSLKLDDIPEEYSYKYDIWRFESFYWEKKIYGNKTVLYDAAIDTTFALYRPGKITDSNFWKSIRAGTPYTARHLGWYVNSQNMSKNEKTYFKENSILSTSNSTIAMQEFRYAIIELLCKTYDMDILQLIRRAINASPAKHRNMRIIEKIKTILLLFSYFNPFFFSLKKLYRKIQKKTSQNIFSA